MIVDSIKNASLYYSLSPSIQASLEYLEKNSLVDVEAGKYPLVDDKIILAVNEYETKSASGSFLEGHRKNIDVQFMISGEEKIGFDVLNKTHVSREYNDVKDIEFFGCAENFFILKENMFAIFFPSDQHMPGIITNKPEKVKKAVIKIRI